MEKPTGPLLSCLTSRTDTSLKNKEEARKLRVRTVKFVLRDEVLCKRGFSQPYLRCLTPDKSHYVMKDIHERACENHSGARSLVHKIICTGYYWLSMQADVETYVKACDKCQCYNNIPRQPSECLTPMVTTWPFA